MFYDGTPQGGHANVGGGGDLDTNQCMGDSNEELIKGVS